MRLLCVKCLNEFNAVDYRERLCKGCNFSEEKYDKRKAKQEAVKG